MRKATIINMTDDKEHADLILKELKENDGYCPCAIIKNENTKCMCTEFRNMETGTCRCGLYVKSITEIDD